jgi:hypothetical protein
MNVIVLIIASILVNLCQAFIVMFSHPFADSKC